MDAQPDGLRQSTPGVLRFYLLVGKPAFPTNIRHNLKAVGFLLGNPENRSFDRSHYHLLDGNELEVLKFQFVGHPNHVADEFFSVEAGFENPGFRSITRSVGHQSTAFLQNDGRFGIPVNFFHFIFPFLIYLMVIIDLMKSLYQKNFLR